MNPEPRPASEGLFSWAERWPPDEAAAWAAWRDTLTSAQRAEALLPLQAALTGLVAYRQLENHPLSSTVTDFRPHLQTVCVTYDWALDLVASLRGPADVVEDSGNEPAALLWTLERSLTDGVRVARRLLELAVVDAGAFQASCDLFLRDLDRNTFFRPPGPLEFTNVRELVHAESLTPTLQNWKSDAARLTTAVAFLTLVRAHRFLGIADAQLAAEDGLYRAQIVIAAVRRELRTFTRFMMVQGVETLAEEFERRLVGLDAHHVTGTYRKISETSSELDEMRRGVEQLAMSVHSTARMSLDIPVPQTYARSEMPDARASARDGIQETRFAVKEAAKGLRTITRPAPPEPSGRDFEERLLRDVWAFRFIARAFVTKAEAVLDEIGFAEPDLTFCADFARHYRAFARRLLRATDYPKRAALSKAIGSLADPGSVTEAGLTQASDECQAFLAHLDRTFAELERDREGNAFDKEAAAEELRAYLAGSRPSGVHEKVAIGVFGKPKDDEAEVV